jgi:hypothetical protein
VTISDSDIRALSSGSSLNGVVLWLDRYESRDWELRFGVIGVGGSRDIRGGCRLWSSVNGSSV